MLRIAPLGWRQEHQSGEGAYERSRGHRLEDTTHLALKNGSKEGRNQVDHNSHKKLAPSTIKTSFLVHSPFSRKKKITVYLVASQTQHCDCGPPTFRGKCPSQICDS